MMTKKCYAHIKTSIELSNYIKETTSRVTDAMTADELRTVISNIAKKNNIFNIQFRDTDPDWLPPGAVPYDQYTKRYNKNQTQPQIPAQPQQVVIYETIDGTEFTQ